MMVFKITASKSSPASPNVTFALIFPTEPENIGSAIQIYIGIEPIGGRKLNLVEGFGFYIPGLKIDRRN